MATVKRAVPQRHWVQVIGHPVVKVLLPLVVAMIAMFVLHKLASHVKWVDIKTDLAAAPPVALLKAFGFMLCSFAGIALYDSFAVRTVAPGKVPLSITLLAGAIGYAISGLLGVSYLTGTAVRYRIYAAFGLDLAMLTSVVAIAWSGFVSGLALTLGGLLVFHPAGLSAMLVISPTFETILGATILMLLAAYLLWLSTGQRRVHVGGFNFALPNAQRGIALMGAGLLDLFGAALTLYVLMPADLTQNLLYFFSIYFVAVGLGILSHSPGGLGVFEATLIAGLGAVGRSDLVAALLLYRVIYTMLPFVMATLGFGVVMGVDQRRKLSQNAQRIWHALIPLVPAIAAGGILLAGGLLLVSGSLPAEPSRLSLLRTILPLSFIEFSHLVGSIVGLLLIVVARGLYRKLYRAWFVAMVLLAIGLVVSLLKGLDWKVSLSMLATLVVLGLFRSAFYRAEGASVLSLSTSWIISTLVLMVAVFWIGLFAHSHVPYNKALWWDFTWHGDASRFLRASLTGVIVLAAIAVHSFITSRTVSKPVGSIPDAVRKLVSQSEDSEAALALMGDKAFLLSKLEDAFIAYADTGKSLIAKGDPVGDPNAAKELIWQFREMADRQGKRCAFYAVSQHYLPAFLDLGLALFKIGEVARVNLQGFTLDGSKKKDQRQARNRALRDGFTFEVIPACELSLIMSDLRRVSDRWLSTKQGEEKGFALGAFDEAYMANFDVAVLRSDSGKIVAFTNLLQGANWHELSIDLMRYDPQAPSFVMDALFAELMLWGSVQGFHWFLLGAAPFSGMDNRQLAPVWSRIGGFVYEHGAHFYNFEGLRVFKDKFEPEWSPNYLACPGGLAAAQILYEVNVLISGGFRGLVK